MLSPSGAQGGATQHALARTAGTLLAAAWPHPPNSPQCPPRFSLTLFTVVSVLVQPVAVPAPAQVAPERVDALVLAPAVVLGTFILVCGDQ